VHLVSRCLGWLGVFWAGWAGVFQD
jgi:hypothetical protein